jgi:nucleotide-binding universal stress UspA family protein
MLKIQKILVPTDFSPVSAHVIEYASQLALAFKAQLLVVHVVPPSAYPLINVAGMGHFPNLREEIRKRCEEEMKQLLAKVHADVKPGSRVIEGVPFSEILAFAQSEGVDLIVMATHGHTGLKHIVLGSTAERVVRMANCPVLTLRAPD